jgi:hypothetical protein
VQESPLVDGSEGVVPGLGPAVVVIDCDEQGLIEEDLLAFSLTDAVFVGALSSVSVVPVEAFNAAPVHPIRIFS